MMYMFVSSTGCRKIALFLRAFAAKRPLKICIMDHNGYHKKNNWRSKTWDLLWRVSASQQTHILDIGWPNIWPTKMLPYNPRCCSKMLNSRRGQWRERERKLPDALCMEYVPKITNIRYIPKIFQMQLTVLYAEHMGMILSWPFAFRNHQKEALETLGLSFKPLPPAKLWNNMEYHGISYCNQSYIPNLTLVN